MSELPFLPLYIDAYEAATTHLTPLEDGLYCRLLRLMWRSPGCCVPDDPRWLARQMRVDNDTYVRLVMPLIKEFCTVKNGRIIQRRLYAEWAKAKDIIEKKKSAGKLGGDAKALKTRGLKAGTTTVLPPHLHLQSHIQNTLPSSLSEAGEETIVQFPASDALKSTMGWKK
jgi:uncharacterized protein YdaU (DUF1376 family)